MKKILVLLLVCILALSSFAGCGKADENMTDWEYIKDKGTLIVGYDNAFPPMGFVDIKTGEDVGFDLDLAKAVGEEFGVEIKLQPIVWDSKESELEAKAIDCIWNGFTITEEREKTLSFSDPYLKNEQVIVIQKKNVDKFKTMADFEDATLLVQNGSTANDVIASTAELKDNEVVKIEDNVQIMIELNMGVADAAVMDYVVANYLIGTNDDFAKGLAVVSDIALMHEEYGVGFRKGSDVPAELNKALQNMKDSGKLAEVAEKWGLTDLLLTK